MASVWIWIQYLFHMDIGEGTYHSQNGDEGPILRELRIVSQMNVFDHAFSVGCDRTHGVVVSLLLGCRRHIETDTSTPEWV
jgi:hypothetical protein